MQVAAVLEVSRTEKRRSKEPVGERMLSNGLSDRRLSCCEAIQPEDRGFIKICGPRLDLIQNNLPCAPETASAITMLICGPTSTTAVVQHC